MSKRLNIPKGTIFGKLTVVNEALPRKEITGQIKRVLTCKCECGTVKDIYLTSLRSGVTVSCGCFHKTKIVKHGLNKHPLYATWHGMLDRCYNKKSKDYKYYGARGIKVCREWRNKENCEGLKKFIEWNESLPKNKQKTSSRELDRENNNRGYSPANCRWITGTLNKYNKRNNLLIIYEGVKYNLKEFFDKFSNGSVSLGIARVRVQRKGEPLKAVTTSKIRNIA